MSVFATPEPIAVELELTAGDVSIEAGERDDTVVEVRPSDGARRADVAAVELTRVELNGGRLLVRSTRRWRAYSFFSDGGSVEVRIGLPAGSRVAGRTSLGSLTGTGPLADCRYKTSVGDLALERAAAVTMTTGAGHIDLGRADGDAELRTGSGDVRVGTLAAGGLINNGNGDTRVHEISGDGGEGAVEVKSSNGDVRIGRSERALRVKTANGDVLIEHASGPVTATTANGDIRVAAPRRGSVDASTGCGAVEVAVPHGSVAWLDLHARHGHVHNALEAGAPPDAGEATVEVRARSGFGDVTVRRFDADARVGAL